MKSSPLLFVIFFIAISGCEQPQTSSKLSALEASNDKLSKQLDEANKQLAETASRITEVESDWKQFQQSFESEKRQELAKNISALEQMLDQVAKDAESSGSVLKKVQELEAEVVKLRDLCVKHETESADANQLGKIKESVASMAQTVSKLQSSIGANTNIGSKIQTLEISLQSLRNDVSILRTRVR